MYGLRGVGKTVLLNRVRMNARDTGVYSVAVEAPENRSLPAALAPSLRATLLQLSRTEMAKEYTAKAVSAFRGFISALKVKFNDIEVAIEHPSEVGIADSGDLDHDMTELMLAVGRAAKEQETAVILFIDEIQHVQEQQLASLIMALHAASQLQLPITMVGAGLPQLLGQMGDAKSYAERLFEFVHVDKLDKDNAEAAIRVPAERESVYFEAQAIREILDKTSGYPYFLQEWGKHAWDSAATSPITLHNAEEATTRAIAELDASFFRVRLDRLTPTEKTYMRAMAELGHGPHRSGDIAACLGRKVESVAPTRSILIKKGMIYAPNHGDTAFTVPLFDEYMRRAIPEFRQKIL